ncbi:hypothetical protein LTR28_007584 [Elasticomyces elasticus]|nr:hypothetical protein LTR28_007584 [Elasticomyces elasticus]
MSNGTSAVAPDMPAWSPSTLAMHADDSINDSTDVAPALHVSTTFRYPDDPDALRPVGSETSKPPDHDDSTQSPRDAHVYSRETAPNTSRLEAILSSLLGAHTLTYTSGLAAFHALLVHLQPRVVAIGAGYHGCHGVLAIHRRLTGCKIVDLFDEKSWAGGGTETEQAWRLGAGDIVHVETPVNPTGTAFNLQHFASLAHARGALLTVDSTLAPPPLQDPFTAGADFVLHSGTKYIGGHSDMLCGVLAMRSRPAHRALSADRTYLGSVMGSLEGWLGVRSVRTLELRVRRQSANATALARFLHSLARRDLPAAADPDLAAVVARVVERVEHASLQDADMDWLGAQMPGGFGPVFAIWMKTPELARRLPGRLRLFHHATSLGGVESLIEWRRMSDRAVDERLLRVSVGVEDWGDLREDLLAGFRALAEEQK